MPSSPGVRGHHPRRRHHRAHSRDEAQAGRWLVGPPPLLCSSTTPQTDESARSPSQCVTRERILAGAILGLAGPGRKIAGLMTLTVVRPDDLADRILDREKHPQWQGERTKMVYAWPTNEALWARYAELWRSGMQADRRYYGRNGVLTATNREAMDEGANVAWPERHNPDELSALQHAMNLKLDRGEAAFWAEYQNEPLPEDQADDELLTTDQILAKLNGYKRGEVPLAATHLTMFIDVQGKALFWLLHRLGGQLQRVRAGLRHRAGPAHGILHSPGYPPDTLAAATPRAGLEDGDLRRAGTG